VLARSVFGAGQWCVKKGHSKGPTARLVSVDCRRSKIDVRIRGPIFVQLPIKRLSVEAEDLGGT